MRFCVMPEKAVLHLIDGFVIEEFPVPFSGEVLDTVEDQIKVDSKFESSKNIESTFQEENHLSVGLNSYTESCSSDEKNINCSMESLNKPTNSVLSCICGKTRKKDSKLSGMSCSTDVSRDNSKETLVVISEWFENDVYNFISKIEYLHKYANEFLKHKIDGNALRLLDVNHLVNIMNIKLGPALNLVEKIKSLQIK